MLLSKLTTELYIAALTYLHRFSFTSFFYMLDQIFVPLKPHPQINKSSNFFHFLTFPLQVSVIDFTPSFSTFLHSSLIFSRPQKGSVISSWISAFNYLLSKKIPPMSSWLSTLSLFTIKTMLLTYVHDQNIVFPSTIPYAFFKRSFRRRNIHCVAQTCLLSTRNNLLTLLLSWQRFQFPRTFLLYFPPALFFTLLFMVSQPPYPPDINPRGS